MTLTNCTVSGNTAGDGGGLDNDDGLDFPVFGLGVATTTLTNCTVSGNTASGNGGGFLSAKAAAAECSTMRARR